MDSDDYHCKVVKHAMVKELVIFQKGYMKYLTDNYRLNYTEDISIKDIKNFVPDVISFLGAPEKLISFLQIGYFDIPGPSGNIKTIVTPLKQKVDYLGDVKKPRLTVVNEKIKEIGGNPRHGSLFAVEENDGSIFVVEINGDSGVGKSEMIAAFILKWLRNNLEGIRSVKLIAGICSTNSRMPKGISMVLVRRWATFRVRLILTRIIFVIISICLKVVLIVMSRT